MRTLLAIALLAGCDKVFDLERPPPGQFCLQAEQEDAAFCADFDDEDGSEPLAAFDAPDSPDRYAVDATAAHSKPRGAHLTIQGMGDAKLVRQVDVGADFEASLWVNVVSLNRPTIDAIKVLGLSFGEVNASVYEKVIYLTSGGNLNEKVGASMFPTIKQVDALTLGRWTHIALAIHLESATGEITIDDDEMPFSFTPIAAPEANQHVVVRVGPHDGMPLNMPIDTEVFVDDVVVRTSAD